MVPNTAHLIWIGPRLPFIHALSIRSAALRGGFDRVVLHHTEELERAPWWDDVFGLPGVELRRVDPRSFFEDLGRVGTALATAYERLPVLANRADLLRVGVLYREGGVYLDTDVVVLRPLTSLLDAGMFLGANRSVYAWDAAADRSIARFVGRKTRSFVRRVLSLVPDGHRVFRHVEHLYPANPNTAIWGSRPAHPFVARTIEELARLLKEVDIERRQEYNFVGPFLVQRLLIESPPDDLVVHPPAVFYPLGPVIARHWLKPSSARPLEHVIDERTVLVHWFASGAQRDLQNSTTPASIRANADRQIFSRLALPFVEGMA